MGRTAHSITIPGNNTARLRTFPVQQLDHRRKPAHDIPLILLILVGKILGFVVVELIIGFHFDGRQRLLAQNRNRVLAALNQAFSDHPISVPGGYSWAHEMIILTGYLAKISARVANIESW